MHLAEKQTDKLTHYSEKKKQKPKQRKNYIFIAFSGKKC